MDHQRIRVAHLIYNFDIERGGGGITRFAIELCRKLDQSLFDGMIFALWDSGTLSEKNRIDELKSEGIRVEFLTNWNKNTPYRSFFNATNVLSSLSISERIDILHSHSEFSDIAALFVKIFAKKIHIIRTVQYGFSTEWRKRPIRRLLLTNFLYPIYFDIEIGVNTSITERLNRRSLAQLSAKKAITIHNGIPLEKFGRANTDIHEMKSTIGIHDDNLVIGTVGRLEEQKGYRYFVDAACIVLQNYPDVHFIIIGEGDLKHELESHTQDLGIAQNIHFTGARNDIPELYACMDIFVSASLWEGLPNVLLESIASNIPVVATDIPGTREVIRHGFNGLLAQPADDASLAKGMITMIESPHLRQTFTMNARDILSGFSIERISKQYEAVYLNIVNKVD